MKKIGRFAILGLLLVASAAYAQSQLVGFLSTEETGVELRRVDTDTWVPIDLQSVVGVGDAVRTSDSGSATINLLDGGARITLQANTTVRLDRLESTEDNYIVSYTIFEGNARQILINPDDKPATYEVKANEMRLITRSAQFDVWAVQGGETDVIARAGAVFTVADGGELVEIPPQTGVRTTEAGTTSELLPVSNINQLRASLDGVPVSFSFDGDILLNVRRGPNSSTESLGTVAPRDINRVLGVSEDGAWYRVELDGIRGWVNGGAINVSTDETFLATFPADFIESDDAALVVQGATDERVTPANASNSGPPGAALVGRYSEEELMVVAMLNEWRISQNLWPFKLNETLTEMARDQANYVSTLSDFPTDPHVDANGLYPPQRAVTARYQWPYYGAENRTAVGEIAYNGFDPSAAVNFWQNSSIHNSTVTNAGYREVGVAAVPSPFGSLYMVVLGSRPDVLPALIEPGSSAIYVPNEQYQYRDGGNWIAEVQEVQVLDSVLSELDDGAWATWGPQLALPTSGEFAVAFRSGEKLVITPVQPAEDIALLPSNIPTEETMQAAAEGGAEAAAPAVTVQESAAGADIPVVEFDPVEAAEADAPLVDIDVVAEQFSGGSAEAEAPAPTEDTAQSEGNGVKPLPFAVATNTPNP